MRSNPEFGLMFFASHQDALAGDKYRVVMESARFADRNGFSSIWIPERHFTRFGCLFPNPAVLHAAIARETTRLGLRTGSVVLPLHDPLRVAEEWAMVDNLSGGRVGLSFASGWNPGDFALQPENYENRHDLLFSNLEKVRSLWRGGSIEALDGKGQTVRISVFPTPVQPELPVWITAAGNPRTYERAGAAGANLLTHLLDHGVEKLAGLIDLYRRSRERHGHDPDAGSVTVMLHTFVGADEAAVVERVRKPFCDYLKLNAGLLEGLAQSRGRKADVSAMSSQDLDAFTGFLFERFYASRALIGTPESCIGLVRELGSIGVDEIACLLDFGPSVETILEHLPWLNRLRELSGEKSRTVRVTNAIPVPAEVRLRCTEEISGPAFYRLLEDRGVVLSGPFRSIERVWRRDGEAIAAVGRPEVKDGTDGARYLTHPAFLDCLFQVLVMAAPAAHFDTGGLYLPSALGSFEVYSDTEDMAPGDIVWSHAVLRSDSENVLTGDITITGTNGDLIARADGMRLEKSQFRETAGEGLLYTQQWSSAPFPTEPDAKLAAKLKGHWLILPDTHGVAEQLRSLLEAAGQECTIAETSSIEKGHWRGIVLLGPWQDILRITRSLPQDARVWIATRGGQAVNGGAIDTDGAMLWGIGRTCAAEFPEQWGGLVDLDPLAPATESAAQLFQSLTSADGEDQVAFRAGERYVARLTRCDALSRRKLRPNEDGAYLITGGAQGFGLEAARRLADRGARHLILLGRRPGPLTFPSLEAAGASVTYASVDVSDAEALTAFIENWKGPRIRGVIHAASTWQNDSGESLVRPLAELDHAAFLSVLGPKRGGALALHQALKQTPLDFFVLFSSAASLVGSPGQANYAAASASLDAIALQRHAEGLPALSIDWGPVSEAGFGATPEGERLHRIWEGLGIQRIAPAEALDIMEALIRDGRAQSAVMRVDWAKACHAFPGFAGLPYLEQLAPRTAPAIRTEFILRFEAAAQESRGEMLRQHITYQVAAVMELPPGEHLDINRGLFDYGLDSLMVIDLKNRLQASLGQNVPATLAFEYPTIAALANYFYPRLAPAETSNHTIAPEPRPTPDSEINLSEIDSMLARMDTISDAQAGEALRARGLGA